MKNLILFLLTILIPSIGVSQNIEFTYQSQDNNGDIFTNMSEDKFALDSFLFFNGNGEDFDLDYRGKTTKYNNNGDTQEVIYHFWDSENNNWIKKDTLSFTFYSNNQIKSSFRRPWDSSTNRWTDTTFFNLWDNNNNLILSIYKRWDYNENKITRGTHTINTYNSDNLILSKETKSFNIAFQCWEKVSLDIYHYNENNNLDTFIVKLWDTNLVWKTVKRTLYNYNDNNLLAKKITETTIDNGITWIKDKKELNTFDNSNNLIETSFLKYENSNWVNNDKYNFIYNTNNNIIKNIHYKYKEDEWKKVSRTTSSYNDNNDILEYKSEQWDNISETWINGYITINKYDNNFNKIEKVSKLWNENLDKWDNRYKILYFWSKTNTINNTFHSNRFDIFPNPTNSILNINTPLELNKISILNTSGRIMKTFNHSKRLNISELPKGIYFLKANSKNKSFVKKLIKN